MPVVKAIIRIENITGWNNRVKEQLVYALKIDNLIFICDLKLKQIYLQTNNGQRKIKENEEFRLFCDFVISEIGRLRISYLIAPSSVQ